MTVGSTGAVFTVTPGMVVVVMPGAATWGQMGATGAHLLNLACGIPEQIGAALPGESMHWAVTPEKLERAGVTAEHCAACAEQTRAELERVTEAVKQGDFGAAS